MRSLATWCVRHRRLVVLFWLVALIGMSAIAHSVGSAYSNSFSLPHTESTDAISLLQSVSPKVSGDTEQIVFQTSDGKKVNDPAVQSSIETMLGKVAKLPHVSNIVSPYGPLASTHVSSDGTIAYATVTFDELTQNLSTDEAKDLVSTAQSADGPGIQVAVTGQLAEQADK